MIFLCILPLFIIDKPWHIIAYQLFFATVFVVCSRVFKSTAVFLEDIFYLPIYLALGIGANLFSLIDKVESAENFVRIRHVEPDGRLVEAFGFVPIAWLFALLTAVFAVIWLIFRRKK